MLINSIRGAQASAIVYSISETAKLNDLNPYYYFKYLLEEVPRYMDEKGNIEASNLEALLLWSERLGTSGLEFFCWTILRYEMAE